MNTDTAIHNTLQRLAAAMEQAQAAGGNSGLVMPDGSKATH